MHLIPHEWRHLDNWRREMERFFSPLAQGLNSPRVDILETEDELVAVCELPGIEKKEDLHIDVADNTLIISGNFRRWREIEDRSMHRRERYVGNSPAPSACPCLSRRMRSGHVRNGLLEVHARPTCPGRQIDIEFS